MAIDVSRGGATQKVTATLAEGNRRFRVSTGEGLPGMHQFNFEMPEFDVQVPEPPEPPLPPHAPGAPRAPMAPHAWSWSDDGHSRAFRLLGAGPRKLGIEYMEHRRAAGRLLPKLPGKTGVLVTRWTQRPAAKAGMKAGDVILKLGTATIAGGDDLREAVSEAEGGKDPTVTVQRDGRPLTSRSRRRSRRRRSGAAPRHRRLRPLRSWRASAPGSPAPEGGRRAGRGRSASTSSRSRTSSVPHRDQGRAEDEVGEGHEQPQHAGEAEARALGPARCQSRFSLKESPRRVNAMSVIWNASARLPQTSERNGPTTGRRPSRKTPGAAARK